MFTNKGKPPESTVPTMPEPQRRPPPSRLMTSIIANGVRIKGTIEADGAELQIDGEIDGNVRGGSLTIGDTGLVKGDIVSESVLVNGRVEGSLRARKIQLARNAHVLGDITHQSLSVEMGAVFEGQCRYLQDPLKTDGPAPSTAPQLSAPTPPAAPEESSSQFGEQPKASQESQTEGGGRLITGVIVTGAAS